MKLIPRLTIAAALCGTVTALSAAPALAQSPSADGYNEAGLSMPTPPGSAQTLPSQVPKLAPVSGTRPETNGAVPIESKELPFTGFGLPLLALLGGALVAVGALARRRLRPAAQQQASLG